MSVADTIALTHARLVAIVRGITPLRRPDLPFVCSEDDDGRVAPLESLVGGHRHFVWRSVDLPARPSDRLVCRATWRRVLRVRYDRDQADGDLDLEMAQDAIRIEDALRLPDEWQMGTTGILAVLLDGPIGTTTTDRYVIVGYPYTLTLEACC